MTNSPLSVFEQLVDHQLEDLDIIRRCLVGESQAFSEREVEKITVIAEKKAKHAERVNQLTSHLNRLLTTNGFSADKQGVEQLFVKYSNDPKVTGIKKKWQKLIVLTRKCQGDNAKNAGFASVVQQFYREALSVLTPHATKSQATYLADGMASSEKSNRSLGSA